MTERWTDSLDHDHRIALAVKFYEDQQQKPKPERWSIQRIAAEFSTAYATLWGRLQGAATRQSSHQTQQKLTVAEEVELLEWLLRVSDARIPYSPQLLTCAAKDIIHHRHPNETIGQNWHLRFRNRHREYVESKLDRHLPKSRARAVTADMMCDWANVVCSLYFTQTISHVFIRWCPNLMVSVPSLFWDLTRRV